MGGTVGFEPLTKGLSILLARNVIAAVERQTLCRWLGLS